MQMNHIQWYFLFARTFTKNWCSVGMFMTDAQIAKGTSSVYGVSEIKWEIPFSSSVLHE